MKDHYTSLAGETVLSGLQSLVRLPMDQRRADLADGARTAGFITGYPGSPLAGYDVELARHDALLADLSIVHQPALNEELGATAVAGSQLAAVQPGRRVEGVAALWYGKAPGLDRAGDAVRHGNLMGSAPSGGVLVCVGDDPQAKSSSVPSTSEPTLCALGLAVLSPADPQELLDLGLHGYALSRASGLWVGIRIPASVADATQTVELRPDRVRPIVPELVVDGRRFVHRPTAELLGETLINLERSLYGSRLEMARRYVAENALNRIVQRGPDDVLGVVAAGPNFLAVRYALDRLGIGDRHVDASGVRLLKVAAPYPLDAAIVRTFSSGLREVVVVEDKQAFLELQVKDALYAMTGAPTVVGKRDERGQQLLPSAGEIDPDALALVLAARLLRQRDQPSVRQAAAELSGLLDADDPLDVVRGAYFCAGCPHNTGVKVPSGATVGSGSGCHGLAIQMDPRQTGNVVGRFQMGGEGAMWNGMAPFVSAGHFFQNLGDGTFAHSGSQSIRASVAAGVDITYKLLRNSVVAMTGGQDIPGGRSIADLARLLLAEGVKQIIVTTDDPRRPMYADLPRGVEVWDRRRIVAAEETLALVPGVTVLIHDQECAIERRRSRERRTVGRPARRVFINPLVCEGCGDCGAVSNCVSVRPVVTTVAPRTEIHQESCNLDYACLEADCPALVTVEPSWTAPSTAQPPADIPALPDPDAIVNADPFAVRITGIGGTGVVTVSRIITLAAHLAGRWARGMNQTGIAQKGGSVCSDVRIGGLSEERPHRLGAGECDLYLGCDLLVSAEPRHLMAASPDRTVAVVSSSAVPTGRQAADRTIVAPSVESLRERVERRTRAVAGGWVDAQDLSRRRFGSDVYANVLLLGVAYQLGALPLKDADIEEAIRCSGVAAATNIDAFRYGRLVATGSRATPGETSTAIAPRAAPPRERAPVRVRSLATALAAAVGSPPNGELDRIVRARIADLISYQDGAYARRYAETVARCRAAEQSACGVADGPFARAVAVQLHRLMAYKDEYEVARLHRDRAVRNDLERHFGRDARVQYHLRPPLLRSMGLERKIVLGTGARATLAALASMRRLRGTPLDPFGHARLRRLERELRDEYEALVSRLCDSLDPDRLPAAVAVAGLPDMVRGYGRVKLAAVDRYRSRLSELVPPAAGDRPVAHVPSPTSSRR